MADKPPNVVETPAKPSDAMAVPLDLDEVKSEFLNLCGYCDAGLPTACVCSVQDYRPTMLGLVEELAEARRLLEIAAGREDCPDWRAGRKCLVCRHNGCGWCPECHPEVPEW